ncbi:MAG: DUF4382 domain-containing protein [Armatimonadetes bacterium]|nr:DUF4382 domain-containing protein [Armatimonadota bacterium]
MRSHIPFVWALSLTIALGVPMVALSGCGGGGDGERTGTLSVAITDAPGEFAEVHLSILEVRVVPTGDAGEPTGPGLPLIARFDPPREVDLLELAYAQELLGTAVVPAGEYTQVRLVLAPNVNGEPPANYVTLLSDPGTQIPLDTPSAQQSGLKLLGKYVVTAGETAAIVLDFDPARAIVEAGNSGKYLLKPTGVRITQVDDILSTYGALLLTVEPAEAWPSALVSVVPEGGTVPLAVGTVDPTDGHFRALLPPGSYAVRVTADGYPDYDSALLETPVYFDVVVGADTDAGVIDVGL